MTIFIYVFLTFLSLFPFYFIVSHLYFSEKASLNLLAVFLGPLCGVFHYAFLSTGVLPLVNIPIDLGEGWLAVITGFVCDYSYAIPSIIAYRKYY